MLVEVEADIKLWLLFSNSVEILLTPFEGRLYDMVGSIKFKSVRNDFQSTLREDLNRSSLLEIYSCLLIKQRSCMKCD